MSKKYERKLIAMVRIDPLALKTKGYYSGYDGKAKVAITVFRDKKGRWWAKAEEITEVNNSTDAAKDDGVPF